MSVLPAPWQALNDLMLLQTLNTEPPVLSRLAEQERRTRLRLEACHTHFAASKLQKVHRGKFARTLMAKQKQLRLKKQLYQQLSVHLVVRMQAAARGLLLRRRMLAQMGGTISLQTWWRRSMKKRVSPAATRWVAANRSAPPAQRSDAASCYEPPRRLHCARTAL